MSTQTSLRLLQNIVTAERVYANDILLVNNSFLVLVRQANASRIKGMRIVNSVLVPIEFCRSMTESWWVARRGGGLVALITMNSEALDLTTIVDEQDTLVVLAEDSRFQESAIGLIRDQATVDRLTISWGLFGRNSDIKSATEAAIGRVTDTVLLLALLRKSIANFGPHPRTLVARIDALAETSPLAEEDATFIRVCHENFAKDDAAREVLREFEARHHGC